MKACHVTKDTDELTIIGHGEQDHCTNPVIGAAAITDDLSSNGDIQGKWTAFEWSTSAKNNAESQGLECTIELSENASTDAVGECQTAN